jgi:hypothetical protein
VLQAVVVAVYLCAVDTLAGRPMIEFANDLAKLVEKDRCCSVTMDSWPFKFVAATVMVRLSTSQRLCMLCSGSGGHDVDESALVRTCCTQTRRVHHP